MTRYLELPIPIEEYFNYDATLTYGLTMDAVRATLLSAYDIIHSINKILTERASPRLEELLLGNSFSGILSEVLVRGLADNCDSLIRNRKVGGHPDLLPVGVYDTDEVDHGTEGIEVKVSRQKGGWQGHNPERIWVMVFRYSIDLKTEPIEDRRPTEFVQVLLARLEKEDWSFSGRKGESRRTPTASILASGVKKLRANPIYQHPEYIVGKGQALQQERLF